MAHYDQQPPPSPYASSPVAVNNTSEYSLATVDMTDEQCARMPLLSPASSNGSSYGSTSVPEGPTPAQRRRILITAGVRMAAVFIVSCCILGGTLWVALPTLEDVDRDDLRIPKSFAQLQALNQLLKKYRDIYPYRIVVCYVTTYLFLQAFSLPGSMYLSILGGAVWGVPRALPLACACVATGATLCYLISAALGPALLTLPSWRARFETWSAKVTAQRANLMSFLIVIRIAPLPPHWVVNVLCPHVGIGIVPFWVSTFMGIFGVTVIHTTIGGGLDEMTSAADFHLLSVRNFLGLAAIVVGVLIPVGLRFYFKREVPEVIGAADEEEESMLADDEESQLNSEDRILAQGRTPVAKATGQPLFYHDESDEEDPIIEAGPAIVIKDVDEPMSSSPGSSSSSSSVRA